ncbi:MAG: LptF/LptG family permease [Bacteroidales bacterium]|nr:LptF/LptG family permease [Bacteroidales bacterium]
MLKKLDIFLLKSYSGPLVATFFISMFVLLMQFLWKYIDDLVGKGLDGSIIAELMFYASISVIPMALPLAILLASIMTFGNLGEKFELTAIKAAGISLQRAMRPLIIVTSVISLGAFYVANNVIPYANLKMSALLWSIRQQRPEMNIKPHVFNNDIENFSIRISGKNPVSNMMYDFVVYDHTRGKFNSSVIIADSGSMKMTEDNRYMIVTLYNGCSYEEQQEKKPSNYPCRKDEFDVQTFVFNLSGLDFSRTDENLFKNNYQVKNVVELEHSTDSLQNIYDRRAGELISSLQTQHYMRFSVHKVERFSDSLANNREHKSPIRNYSRDFVSDADEYALASDTAYMREDSVIRLKVKAFKDSVYNSLYAIPTNKIPVTISLDSIYERMDPRDRERVISETKRMANETQAMIGRNNEDLASRLKTIAKYRNAWHQKFTLSFACMIFFFIGAPLGAIIRKGGFGLPIVISVIVFLIYYLISTAGMKMSRDGNWEPWQGMWISSVVILPLGVFLTYKATVDAQLFNSEAWLRVFSGIGQFFKKIFKSLSDTGDNNEPHPLRNAMQTIGLISGAAGFGFAFTPMKKTAMVFGAVAIAASIVVYLQNRKLGFKSKFAILAAILGIAAITVSASTLKKKKKVAEPEPQATEQAACTIGSKTYYI